MRKLLCVFVAFFFVSMSLTGLAFDAHYIEADQNVGTFCYPITAESEEWDDYSVRKKVEMLKIPDNILNAMSDEMLVQAIAEYPYLVDIYLYGDSVEDGIAISRTYFSALDELLSRESASTALSSHGIDVANSHLATYQSDLENADNHDLFVAQALLDILQEVDGGVNITYISGEYSMLNSERTEEMYGVEITVTVRTEWHTPEQHAVNAQETVEKYGVTLISPGTCRYNCHSYAWYSQSASNTWWINDPTPIMKWGTPSMIYSGVLGTSANSTNIRYGDKIFYGDLYGNEGTWHSAIYISTAYNSGVPIASQLCRSKWGESGVFEHTMANIPAGYDIYNISAWRTN